MRFTIRDVLWLTVVSALAVGWWMNRAALSARRDARIAEVQRTADEAAKRCQIEVSDWKFRAESLRKFIEDIDGKVVFRTGKTGRQEVVAEHGIGTQVFLALPTEACAGLRNGGHADSDWSYINSSKQKEPACRPSSGCILIRGLKSKHSK
jgi:hypothetical protein